MKYRLDDNEIVDEDGQLIAHFCPSYYDKLVPLVDQANRADNLPADWHQDSSLETWFLLTAQELRNAKTEIAKQREQIEEPKANRADTPAGFDPCKPTERPRTEVGADGYNRTAQTAEIAELKALVERLSADPTKEEATRAGKDRDNLGIREALRTFVRNRLSPKPTPEERVTMIEVHPGYWTVIKDGEWVGSQIMYQYVAEIVRDKLIAQLKEADNGK